MVLTDYVVCKDAIHDYVEGYNFIREFGTFIEITISYDTNDISVIKNEKANKVCSNLNLDKMYKIIK